MKHSQTTSPPPDNAPAKPARKRGKAPSTSPTQRSLKHLRNQGWTVAIVEHWNSWTKIRQDLFGVFDLLAIRKGPGFTTKAIQVTSTTNVSSRRKKIMESPHARLWCDAGNLIELHGWSKKGPRGKPKKWVLTVESFTEASWLQVPF